MQKSELSVPVLIIFFNRPDKLELVFDQVRKAKPSELYLYQDGARIGRNDESKIKECRKIVDNIDWDCKVHYKYQEKNFGCDPSEYIAIKWLFENNEKGIILEDDDVPAISFFKFSEELLEKYKSNEQIHMICGMNNLGSIKRNTSYIFSKFGSIWGWATWKRVIDSWDGTYSFLENIDELNKMKSFLDDDRYFNQVVDISKRHKNTMREHYESINGCSQYINHRLNIVPVNNMISNIGIGADTTHSTDDIRKLPRAVQKLMYMKTHEFDNQLIHPDNVSIDVNYDKKYKKLMFPNFIIKFFRRIEGYIRKKIYK